MEFQSYQENPLQGYKGGGEYFMLLIRIVSSKISFMVPLEFATINNNLSESFLCFSTKSALTSAPTWNWKENLFLITKWNLIDETIHSTEISFFFEAAGAAGAPSQSQCNIVSDSNVSFDVLLP